MNTARRFPLCALGAVLLMRGSLAAATFSWDGGTQTSEDWSVATNWLSDIAPPSDGTADIIFSGNTGLTANANLDWSIRSLTFASGALGFTVQGNPLTLGAGGITNADDSVQTIGNDLILAAAQTFRTTSTGSMAINGSINTNGRVLTVDAATDFITLAGAITGSGGLIVTGANSLVLAGGESNTFTGGTTINGPIVLAKTGGATAIPGAVIVGSGSSPATLAIGFDEQIGNASSVTINAGSRLSLGNGVTETLGALSLSGTTQVNNGTLNVGTISMFGGAITTGAAGKITLGGEITAVSAGSQPAVISGNLNLGGATRTITVVEGVAATELEIEAAVSNGSVAKEGAGRLVFNGAQNYSSLLVRQGTVDLNTALGAGASSVSVIPIAGTAAVNFDVNQRLAGITIGSGGIVTIGPSSNPGESSGPLAASEENVENFVASGSHIQGIPEPATGLLLLSALPALLARRRETMKDGRGERI